MRKCVGLLFLPRSLCAMHPHVESPTRLVWCGCALVFAAARVAEGGGGGGYQVVAYGAALSAGGWMMLPYQPYFADVLSSLLWLLLVHDLVVMIFFVWLYYC